MAFDSQVKFLIMTFKKDFDRALKKVCKKDVVNDKFSRDVSEILKTFVNKFKTSTQELILSGSNWQERLDQ